MVVFEMKGLRLLLLLLLGAVGAADVWRQFEGQPFPWKKVKSTVESVLPSSAVPSMSPLRTVVAQCGERNLLVVVRLDLFGTKHLVKVGDLTLGPGGCPPTGENPQNQTALFNYGLHECGTKLQMVGDFLVYATYLNYTPKVHGATIVRTNGAVIPIQCHYFRKGNVSSDPIKPTWIPFSSTKSGEGHLSFSLRLMNDDWLTERTSATYYLGELIHIEASVSMTNHMPLKLYIDRCVATLSPDKDSIPSYNIIDYNGCLVDSAAEDSYSTFTLPGVGRELDKLRFDLDAFRFFGDDRSLIFITCLLKVTTVERSDSRSKACTFQKTHSIWTPLEESNVDVCACCRKGNCAATTPDLVAPRARRDIEALTENETGLKWEGVASLGPLVILDTQVSSLTLPLNEFEQRGPQTSRMGGLPETILTVTLSLTAVLLASTTLMVMFLYRRRKQTLFK